VACVGLGLAKRLPARPLLAVPCELLVYEKPLNLERDLVRSPPGGGEDTSAMAPRRPDYDIGTSAEEPRQ
jgi:hypothetical protein